MSRDQSNHLLLWKQLQEAEIGQTEVSVTIEPGWAKRALATNQSYLDCSNAADWCHKLRLKLLWHEESSTTLSRLTAPHTENMTSIAPSLPKHWNAAKTHLLWSEIEVR